MREILLLVITLLFISAAMQCLLCKRPFDSPRGLAVHFAKCPQRLLLQEETARMALRNKRDRDEEFGVDVAQPSSKVRRVAADIPFASLDDAANEDSEVCDFP